MKSLTNPNTTVPAGREQAETSQSIRFDPDELWWGGAVDDGALMPYIGAHKRDLRQNIRGNQATPLLLSSKGAYIWLTQPFAFHIDQSGGRMDIESDNADILQKGGNTDLVGAFRAASRRFFPGSGECPDALNFSAPQYNSWIEMQYEPTQEKVLAYADGILAGGLSPGVLMIDDGWFISNGAWRFNLARFPNPTAMVKRLHDQGFAAMLWVSPFITPDGDIYRWLLAHKLLVREAGGEPAIRKWWNGYSALLDVSHPDAIEWIHSQLGALQSEYGIDGFKFDAGDPEYNLASDLTHGGLSPTGYCQAWAEVGLRYPRFNEYRACWNMPGRPLIQRQRDKNHVWGSGGLADLVPNGIAQGLAGYSFVCPDMIGGGDIDSFTTRSTGFDQELFVRMLQCSMLFPIVQFSIAPWRALDEEHWQSCRQAIEARQSLTPYILRLVDHAAKTSEPILRHMCYEFPQCGLEQVRDQFMLGPEILVAPVLEKGARSRLVSFPPGTWEGDSGGTVVGPCEKEIDVPLSRLPWFRAV